MIRAWFRRRREARIAAYEQKLDRLRALFPGEPDFLIRGLAAGGIVAACAMKTITEFSERKARENRLREIIRDELDKRTSA